MEKFSKPLGPYVDLLNRQPGSTNFCDESNLVDVRYVLEDARAACCNCSTSLGPLPDIIRRTRQGVAIPYSICRLCTHVNGMHMASTQFLADSYPSSSDQVGLYNIDFYADASRRDFELRMSDIYEPKASFLREALVEINEFRSGMKVLDIGAGAGHFVEALRRVGFTSEGTEPMPSGVEAARESGIHDINLVPIGETVRKISSFDGEIISMMCLLPHLEDVGEVMAAIRSNTTIRFVYQLLPLVSLSSLLTLALSGSTARVLSGTHTHLHTNDSLRFLENAWGMTRESAWWFGTDAVSLVACIESAILETAGVGDSFTREWVRDQLRLDIDQVQSALDQRRQSDQVHLLWRVM